jgi:hypothetical protein
MTNCINFDLVTKALLFLENEGWSDLIDKRWKKDVTKTLTENFPDMNKETLQYVLESVLY